MELWKENLSKTSKKAADALADPGQYENLFPGMAESLVAEQYLAATEETRPAAHYPMTPVSTIGSSTVDGRTKLSGVFFSCCLLWSAD